MGQYAKYNNADFSSMKLIINTGIEAVQRINEAVQSQVGDVKKEVGMTKLQSELANKGLNPEQIQSFMDFASKNPAEYGIDGAINMWQAVTQNQAEANVSKESPLDVVRQNQSVPQQAPRVG